MTKRDSCNLLSELFFVLNHPRPAMASIAMVDRRKPKCLSEEFLNHMNHL